MDENFYEETVSVANFKKQKIIYVLLNISSYISYAFAIIFALLVFGLYDFSKGQLFLGIAIIVITFAVFISCGIILAKSKNKFCVEYDYSFMSGTVNVSKIINQTKRIEFLSFETKSIDKIGVFNSEEYIKIKNIANKEVFLTSNNLSTVNKKFYYIYLMKNAERNLYIFECSDTFIKYIIKYTNRNAIDKEFL